MTAAAAAHPEAERVELWFMDEARIGQKGRTTHLWYERGVRPRGAHDVGFASTWLFAAACPERDAAVGLVLPEVSTAAMNLFLAAVAQDVPPGTHAVLVLDQAGWHTSRGLAVPPNLTLVHLPPSSPELNPVEKLWQFLRERLLSHRVFHDLGAVIDATCAAWNRLVAEPGRVRSLTAFPWLPLSVITS
jgi:hypothetical protein